MADEEQTDNKQSQEDKIKKLIEELDIILKDITQNQSLLQQYKKEYEQARKNHPDNEQLKTKIKDMIKYNSETYNQMNKFEKKFAKNKKTLEQKIRMRWKIVKKTEKG